MPNQSTIATESQKRFPAHGWTCTSKGSRILCFPILQMFGSSPEYWKIFHEKKLAGTWLNSRTPARTLNNLIVALRDLHKEIRLACIYMEGTDKTPPIDDKYKLTRHQEGMMRMEVLTIAIFTLLRRLADELIDASRPIIFKHWQNAPREMKNAIKLANSGNYTSLHPIHNITVYKNAMLNHTAWLNILRAENGIRDILTHRPHQLSFGMSGHSNPMKWNVSAYMVQFATGGHHIIRTDLINAILECLRGACNFMEQMCLSVNMPNNYQSTCLMYTTGWDMDIIGFWPSIDKIENQFPLFD